MTQECCSSSSQGGLLGGRSAACLRADHSSMAGTGQAELHLMSNLDNVAGVGVAGLQAH